MRFVFETELRLIPIYLLYIIQLIIQISLPSSLSPQLYGTWNNLSKIWTGCNSKLEECLRMALHYQDSMQVS